MTDLAGPDYRREGSKPARLRSKAGGGQLDWFGRATPDTQPKADAEVRGADPRSEAPAG